MTLFLRKSRRELPRQTAADDDLASARRARRYNHREPLERPGVPQRSATVFIVKRIERTVFPETG